MVWSKKSNFFFFLQPPALSFLFIFLKTSFNYLMVIVSCAPFYWFFTFRKLLPHSFIHSFLRSFLLRSTPPSVRSSRWLFISRLIWEVFSSRGDTVERESAQTDRQTKRESFLLSRESQQRKSTGKVSRERHTTARDIAERHSRVT